MTEVRTIGRYRLMRTLGRGAVGVVHAAEDVRLGRHVALKILESRSAATGSEEYRARFLREARLVAGLNHPNIVSVYDVGEDAESGEPYIVMELVEGETLADRLSRQEVLPPAEAASIVRQAALGLHHAHQKGIVHRDVKPGNILINPEGEAKVADFGIARPMASEMTCEGQMLGTPHYMSPEQITGDGIDPRSDIFALGIVLYQALTGEKPFGGDTLTAASYRVVHTDPPSPSAIRPSVPDAFDAVVLRALSKNPADRHPNARAFADELEPLTALPAPEVHEPVRPLLKPSEETLSIQRGPGVSARDRLTGWLKARWPTAAAAAGGGLAVLAVVWIASLWAARVPGEPGKEDAPVPAMETGKASPGPAHAAQPAVAPPNEPRATAVSPRTEQPPTSQQSPAGDTQAPGAGTETVEPGATAPLQAAHSTVRFFLRHRQHEGTLTLLLDGDPVHESALGAEGTFSKEEVIGSFQAPPGTHVVEAVLRIGGDEPREVQASEHVEFREGEERYLQLKYQKFIAKGELKMYWDTPRARRAFEP